jgi:hypothetical protein
VIRNQILAAVLALALTIILVAAAKVFTDPVLTEEEVLRYVDGPLLTGCHSPYYHILNRMWLVSCDRWEVLFEDRSGRIHVAALQLRGPALNLSGSVDLDLRTPAYLDVRAF